MDTVNTQKSLIIGYDLGAATTQINVSVNGGEPESVNISVNKNMFLIPTALCVRSDSKDWLFGDDALRIKNREAGQFIDNLLDYVEKDQVIDVFGTEYDGNALIEKFIRKSFTALRQRYLQDKVELIVVTVKNKSDRIVAAIEKAFFAMGYDMAVVKILSYMESFMYYAIKQKKELWANDVALFDFDEEGLKYYQLSTSKKQLPITVTAFSYDLSDELSYEMLFTMVESRITGILKGITDKLLYRQILSTIYFTGVGFDGDWANGIIKSLCPGRRVFKGQNLYAKGAAYYGLICQDDTYKDFLFLTENQVRYNVSIRMFKDNRIAEYPIVKAGADWREVNARTVGIIDDTDELFFTLFHTVRKETKHVIVSLRNLEQRENKTTRVHVSAKFIDRDTLVITVKDLGFGEFYANSYRVWEKVITF